MHPTSALARLKRFAPMRERSLVWRIFAIEVTVLTSAFLFLALTPARIEAPNDLEGLVGVVALIAVLVLTYLLLRRAFNPLERLTSVMRRVDPLRPGQRVPAYGQSLEVVELSRAFNEMLDRLETERRESGRRTLAAQEQERRRLARELHDEVGQSLTALLLQLEHASRGAPPATAELLMSAQETGRSSLEEVRTIARRLRPEALDDLGLRSALVSLSEQLCEQTAMRVDRHLDADLPKLTSEAELVVYRVAQEGLTNALRHAGATKVELRLQRTPTGVLLNVVDDGQGMNGEGAGSGLKGMRERAILVGASLEIRKSSTGGVDVSLAVPATS